MCAKYKLPKEWSGSVLWLLVACSLFTGCRRRSTQVEIADRQQILNCGNAAEPSTIDPSLVSSASDANIVYALVEGLAAFDPANLRPIPGVAERWESNDDATVWTFHLRPTSRWSNGDQVTAGDFVYSYRRMLSPKLGSGSAYILFRLRNGEAYYNGKITDFGLVGASAPDERTLVLTLQTPTPYFPSMVCQVYWYPVQRATIEKFGAFDDSATLWTRPGNYVGNGPFMLTEWRPNQVIRVVKSPTYWNRGKVSLQGCNFYPIDDKAAEELAFRSGQLHLTQYVPRDKIAAYRLEPSGVLREFNKTATFYLRLNVNKPPLNDVRVRRALALSLDRNEIAAGLLKGGETPARNLTPPGTGGFTARVSMETDIPEAKRLLSEAGYPGGKGFPKLDYLYPSSGGGKSALGEAIQQMWRKNLGIEITLTNQEFKIWAETLQQGNYLISFNDWVADYFDPSTFVDLMIANGGNNNTGWSNAEYDRLDGLAASTPDNGKRFEYFQGCEAILARECPIIPIFFEAGNRLVRPEVKGWYDNPLDIHPLNSVYLLSPN
jgi:oligopeptide transport system substrate-binding protein